MASLARWESFCDLVSLREVIDRLFDESFVCSWERQSTPAGEERLAMDMYTTDENVVVKAAIPGVKPEDINVSIVGDTLIIKGETRAEEKVAEEQYIHRECSYGAFNRSLTLPTQVVADEAEAEFEHGVLMLTIPKEEAKSQTIKIKVK